MYGELPEIDTKGGGKVSGIAVEILNPPKVCVVRLPTNDQMIEYLTAQRSLYKDFGRGIGESEDVPTPKADRKLFDAIRIDRDGAEFDDAEALFVINQITRHRVVSCERNGQEYVVTLNTLFGEVTHTVRIPFQSELATYRRNVYKARSLPHGVTEQRFPPDAPIKLYDQIIQDISGYVIVSENGVAAMAVTKQSAVPPDHKRTVIVEVVGALTSLDPSLDPNS